MKNVIDLTSRLKENEKSNAKGQPGKLGRAARSQSPSAPIIDMTEKRAEIILQERRKVKRTILTDFVGAFVLVPRKGLLKVALFDISNDGLAFDVTEVSGHFSIGEEVAMRVYLNQSTYFPFIVKIQNIRGVENEATFRHGAGFVKGTINDEALHHFVRFIETISTQLLTDKGDMKVSSVVR